MTPSKFIGKAWYEQLGQMIWGTTKRGDQLIIDLRGWGTIKNLFKNQFDAATFQDELGQFVADAINEKIARDSPPSEKGSVTVRRDLIECLERNKGRYSTIHEAESLINQILNLPRNHPSLNVNDNYDLKRVTEFLLLNGYQRVPAVEVTSEAFGKEGCSQVEIDTISSDITFLGDGGDWLSIPLNLYALIGALLHYRELAVNYQMSPNETER